MKFSREELENFSAKLQTLDDSAVTATELEVAAALPVLHTAKNLGGTSVYMITVD